MSNEVRHAVQRQCSNFGSAQHRAAHLVRAHNTHWQALDAADFECHVHLVKHLVMRLLLARALVAAQVSTATASVQEPFSVVLVVLITAAV